MGNRSLRYSTLTRGVLTSERTPIICLRCLAKTASSAETYGAAFVGRRLLQRQQSTWSAAISAAQNAFSGALPGRSTPSANDPLRIVGKELKFLSKNIRQLLGSGHPMLDTVAKYYTRSEGKHIRPMVVLLMSQATSLCSKQSRPPASTSQIDTPITSPSFLSDYNPDRPLNPLTDPHSESDYTISLNPDSSILPSQRRLAEITELIHLASLLHDDVIDHATTRRSEPSANIQFGNKMAVLAGDFLLGRASVALARLRDAEVTELLATVIANLVEGEFMQLKNTSKDEKYPVWSEDIIAYYLEKTYLKTASLISKSCRAAALLGESSSAVVDAAYAYGKNLGLAFQLVDDMLDYTITESELGKPVGADLELGLATAPLLFAWRERPELGELVGRKFAAEGDIAKARKIVASSDGVEQTRALAQEYADKAIAAISNFADGEAKDGLYDMCEKAMNRRK